MSKSIETMPWSKAVFDDLLEKKLSKCNEINLIINTTLTRIDMSFDHLLIT